MTKKIIFILSLLLLFVVNTFSQDTIVNPDIYYSTPMSYEIGGVEIEGIRYLDEDVLIQLSGLNIGTEIIVPGDAITKGVKKLYNQGLFSDIKISVTKIVGDKVFLKIFLQERPRLSHINYIGAKKSEETKLREKVKMSAGVQVTDNLIINTEHIVEKYYKDKGFYNIDINIVQRDAPDKENSVILDVNIKRKEKIKIQSIYVNGNSEVADNVLKRAMKQTKEKTFKNFFKSAKYIEENFDEDKILLVEKYNEKGYRDAVILSDSIKQISEDRVEIYINVEEGDKYYFNNINWKGNTIYTAYQLEKTLKIRRGDVYNKTLLDERLRNDETSVHSLYLDNGYLFCDIMPIETIAGKDSINVEVRIVENDQAKINRVSIVGNTKTHEHVARRELYTNPGDLFSKSDIIRSARELAQLGHFDPEAIAPDVQPNIEAGTVDIIYSLEEKANDQIEISGGWGAGMIIGSVGLTFTNFSMRNMFNKEAWRPLPSGDGQTLSLKAQTNGKYYSSFSLAFTEPWLGGKKRNSFSSSIYYSHQTGYNSGYGYGYNTGMYEDDNKKMDILGASVGLGRRVKWPDDWFTVYSEVSYQRYNLKNWPYYVIQNGISNNLSFRTVISRNSTDNPIYTRRGSDFSFTFSFTPPYSAFNNTDYSEVSDDIKYKWIEYHKWEFKGRIYTPLSADSKLVLYTGVHYGFLGYYDKDRKSPFEGYELGGDGMSGYSLYGKEYVGMRGYENNSLTAYGIINGREQSDANVYSKLTMEVRYPLSLAQSATIYALAFLEAGNSWRTFDEFKPFDLYRSAGIGMRVFLPMFGLLGIDYGYGFDKVPGRPGVNGGQIHFVLGKQF